MKNLNVFANYFCEECIGDDCKWNADCYEVARKKKKAKKNVYKQERGEI